MNIIIHGTNGGYRNIFPAQKTSELIEVRQIDEVVAPIGQCAYSIRFIDGNVIFSKYKIIRDKLGSLRIGNIAFSVFIPNNKNLAGIDIKSLLDCLEKEFSQKHIDENNNLGRIINEDWTFIDKIANEYKLMDMYPPQQGTQGTLAAAFIYYSTDSNDKEYKTLEEYFDAPYHEVYNKYKQVFFVDKILKDTEKNPLNALAHSRDGDLTGKINLASLNQSTSTPPSTRIMNLDRLYEEENKIKNSNISVWKGTSENTTDKVTDMLSNGKNNQNDKSNNQQIPKGGFRKKNVLYIVVAMVAIVFVGIFLHNNGKQTFNKGEVPNENTMIAIKTQIDKYVAGNDLLLDTLNIYMDIWKKYKPNKPDEAKDNEWNRVLIEITQAKTIRENVNECAFAKLNGGFYFGEQSIFENAVRNIDSVNYSAVKERLGDVTALKLSEIAESINNINNDLKEMERNNEKNDGKIATSDKSNGEIKSKSSLLSDNDHKIVNALKSSELTLSKLLQYKNIANDSGLKRNIDLALKFWGLTGDIKTYISYKKSLSDKEYKYLNDSYLKWLVEEIIKQGKNPLFVKDISEPKSNKNLEQLRADLLQ